MRFIIMRKADADTEAGVMPGNDLLDAMAQYNEELFKAGLMLDGMGLHPTATGARVTFENGKPIVTDGPFAETKEVLAGFTLIQAKSMEEALAWVKRWPPQDGNGNVTLELRRVYELEDFEEGPGIEHHRKLERDMNKPTLKINPYLTFNGNCRQAFEYYERVLGGTIEMLQTHGESPICNEIPADMHHLVIHARLNLGDTVLMGSDAPADRYQPAQGISVTLNVDKPDAAMRIFDALADNGTVLMPMDKTFWAQKFGMLADQFGIQWMINCE